MVCAILHGGAGRFVPTVTPAKLPYLRQALDAAWDQLVSGAPGELAVAAALRVMEGCELFNAGYGGYPNVHGIVLLDVGLMKGDGHFVSLINMRRMKYPSAAALDMLHERRAPLMSIWTHELMSRLDNAAPHLKERYGWVSSHEELVAPHVRELLERPHEVELDAADDSAHGTVGCVVRDAHGCICAGTSTGGVSFKSNGRVGDSPVIGSGVFADNEIGGLSTTGHGESILGSVLSGFVVGEMRRELRADPRVFAEHPERLSAILESELNEMALKHPGRTGALVVVPASGRPCFAFRGGMLSVALRSGSAERVDEELVRICLAGGRHVDGPA